jgi:hypothetical protein
MEICSTRTKLPKAGQLTEFLTTTGVSYNIERIIKNASDKLILVSPYLKINERLKQSLEEKNLYKSLDIRKENQVNIARQI